MGSATGSGRREAPTGARSRAKAARGSTSRRQGQFKESKEAWLASHNFGIDHDDPWGRPFGLNGLGSAVPAVGERPENRVHGVDRHGVL